MILPIYNNDSIVYKTDVTVQEDNNDVQNKGSNIHIRLLRKARKAINESVEAEAKAMEKLLTQVIELIRLVIDLLTPSQHAIIITVKSRRRSLNISAKDPGVWDVCINAFGKRVWA